jgi:Ca2+/Na+ antiporter
MENTADQNRQTRLLFFIGLLMILFLGIDFLTELGVADGVLYISVILLAYNLRQQKAVFYLAALCSLLTILGFFYSPPGGELWKVVANRLLALYAIWVTAFISWPRKKVEAQREQMIIELKEAHSRIKILSGFLPICAFCKKIRDDQGQWHQMEAYIRNHSQVEFSHGLCHDCAERVLGELSENKIKAP